MKLKLFSTSHPPSPKLGLSTPCIVTSNLTILEDTSLNMMSDVTQNQLIEVIQNHVQLWDKSHELHSDRIAKQRTWENVAKELTPNWEDLSRFQQESRVASFQKRWRSLSDRVRRDLKKERVSTQWSPILLQSTPLDQPTVFFEGQSLISRARTSNISEEEGSVHQDIVPEMEDVASTLQGSLSTVPISRDHETPVVSIQGDRSRSPARSRPRGRRSREIDQEPTMVERNIINLVEELRQERHRSDVFLDLNNGRSIFCRSLYVILEQLSEDRERQCRENIYCYIVACLNAERQSRPPPPLNVVQGGNMQTPFMDIQGQQSSAYSHGVPANVFHTQRPTGQYAMSSTVPTPFIPQVMSQLPPLQQRMTNPSSVEESSQETYGTYHNL
ncbi:uncharacterized protein LOC143962713 [Lithobates pipiens]